MANEESVPAIDRDLPDGHCPGCGQATFTGKHPELTIEYDGDSQTTRMCRDCVGSPFDVIKRLQREVSEA